MCYYKEDRKRKTERERADRWEEKKRDKERRRDKESVQHILRTININNIDSFKN